MVSDDFPSAFLSLSPEEDDDDVAGLDIDLDAMETPSDSESLPFPIYDLEGNRQTSRFSACYLFNHVTPLPQTTCGVSVWHRALGRESAPAPGPGPGSSLRPVPEQEQEQEPASLDWELWSRRTWWTNRAPGGAVCPPVTPHRRTGST